MYLMVLNDGETYTDLDGCCVIEVDEQLANTVQEFEMRLDALMLSGADEVPGLKIVKQFGETP